MKVYLIQHAKALAKDQDPDRPLSDEGRRELDRMAAFLAEPLDLAVGRIWNSGKTRAAQTAERLAAGLHPPLGVRSADGLSPLDNPQVWVDRLQEMSHDVMLVGHLPHLDRLSSSLLAGDPEAGLIRFRNSGVVCLDYQAGQWALEWILTPQVIP